jgi:hypothetical protein
MELLTKLPVEAGECIRSYVIRLAIANDYDTLTRFFNETSNGKKLNINSSQKSITELVKSLDVRLEQQSFLPATQQIKRAIGAEFMMHEEPHVCPHCLVEKDGVEAKWQLLQFTHCDVHHCELITDCQCGEPFEWNETLLSYGCSNCYSSWNEIVKHTEIKDLPAHVEHFSLLPFNARESFLEDMMTVAIRALRPFDSVHHKIKKLRDCKVNWTDLMTQSFKMLSDSSTITQWMQNLIFTRNHYKSLGDNAVFYPIATLKERLHLDWLIKGYKLKFNTTSPSTQLLSSHGLTTCHFRNSSALKETTKTKEETQFVNQVDQVAFVKMTGCSINTARAIFKMKFIKILSKFGKGRYAFIEMDSFIKRLTLMNSLPPANTVAISQLKGVLSTFCLSPEEVCIKIVNAKLPVYINPNAADFVSSFQVNELQFFEFLEGEYINNSFSLSHTAHLLKIPRDKVKRFGCINLLESLPAPKGQYLYSGASISQFLAQYECLERWAEIHDLCLDKVLKEVISQGIKPTFSPFVFEKSTTLANLLNTLHGNQWYHPEQLTLVM